MLCSCLVCGMKKWFAQYDLVILILGLLCSPRYGIGFVCHGPSRVLAYSTARPFETNNSFCRCFCAYTAHTHTQTHADEWKSIHFQHCYESRCIHTHIQSLIRFLYVLQMAIKRLQRRQTAKCTQIEIWKTTETTRMRTNSLENITLFYYKIARRKRRFYADAEALYICSRNSPWKKCSWARATKQRNDGNGFCLSLRKPWIKYHDRWLHVETRHLRTYSSLGFIRIMLCFILARSLFIIHSSEKERARTESKLNAKNVHECVIVLRKKRMQFCRFSIKPYFFSVYRESQRCQY